MRRMLSTNSQHGSAAVEMALGMALLSVLLMILVEASSALVEYAKLQNAAMEGARMIARQGGDTSGVADYVKSLLSDSLTGADPDVSITSVDANNVKVQVDHVFSFLFSGQQNGSGSGSGTSLLGTDALTISASVTMAVATDS